MFYFADEKFGDIYKGKISLYNCNVTLLEKAEKPFCFCVETKDRTYFISAVSNAERHEWMLAIQQHIDRESKAIDSIVMADIL